METITAQGLTFAVRTRDDDFGPDGDASSVVTVVVTLLDLDGEPTPFEVDRTGVAPVEVPSVARYLAERLAADYPRTTQVSRGAVTWQIRTKPERPWHPEVYRKIRTELLDRGLKVNKAHALASKYAKRKGTAPKLMATFHRDYP